MVNLITLNNITDGNTQGNGHFDKLMVSVSSHLTKELNEDRISKKEYSNVYLQAMVQTLQLALQFELQKETANLNNTGIEKDNFIRDQQLIKIQEEIDLLQTQDLGLIKDNLIKDKQLEKLDEEIDLLQTQDLSLIKDNLIKDKQLEKLNEEIDLLQTQDLSLIKDNLIKDKQLEKMEEEIDLLQSQDLLIADQRNTERAKTQDTLIDGVSPVNGIIGKDKIIKTNQANLYEEQKNAYTTDRKYKVAKIIADSYSINKSQDPGLTPPTSFQNTEIDKAIDDLKTDTGLTI